jgi:hypothetical protein
MEKGRKVGPNGNHRKTRRAEHQVTTRKKAEGEQRSKGQRAKIRSD